MFDIYTLGDSTINKVASGLNKGAAKRFIDSLMASDKKPVAVAYRYGKFAYARRF